jgi:hypothetical protein
LLRFVSPDCGKVWKEIILEGEVFGSRAQKFEIEVV